MFNFMRFGEKGNSIVFDLTSQEKKDLKDGNITMDQIYDVVMKDPVKHVMEVKRRGLERLIAIAGIVDGNQELSNGSGKSTLLEAICYTRYERIVRRTAQKPDSIEKAGLSVVTKIDGKYPSNMKESWVEELCEIGGRIYRIRRGKSFTKSHKSHSPIMEVECLYEGKTDSLMSHRTPDTKANLDEILTMDYDLFVNSQMFGQNDAGKYLTGTDKTKKEMLISLLKLENVVYGCLENIRKKKNSQEKKINIIKAAMDLFEKSLCKKHRELTQKTTEFLDDSIVFEIDSLLNEIISSVSENIKSLEKEICVVDNKIADLSKSEKLQKVESIREEGRRVSKDKKAKEQSMSDQISDWEKLFKESQNNLVKKSSQENSANEKIFKITSSKDNTEDIIKNFDLSKNQEKLQKISKAKQIKPQILLKLSEAREFFQKESNNVAILKGKNKDFMSDLQNLKKYGADAEIICPECKNKVTKEHISEVTSFISKSVEENKLSIEKSSIILEEKRKDVSDYESKLTHINDLLISEASIISAIKGFEDAKTKFVDIENQIKGIKDDLEIIRSEKKEISNNVITYENKICEVRKLFEGEIKVFKDKIEQLVKQLKYAEEEAKNINSQMDILKSQKSDLETKKNKAIELYGSSIKDKSNITGQISEWNGKKKEYEIESRQLNRFLILEDVYGLDGIQTRIVKKYLPLLNIYIKEFLDILSDGLISVKMTINDRSKVDMIISGGTSESYEMLSGGEKTIVRLAVDIGLSLLAFSRTTQKPEMISLDEIFGNLDAGRTRNVFKVLNKLSDKFSRIIIISHDADINNQIKTKIIIEKGGGRMGLSEIKRIE